MSDELIMTCATHGRSPWNGETICECGRVHRIAPGDTSADWQCECGRRDPITCLHAICAGCFAPREAAQREHDAAGGGVDVDAARSIEPIRARLDAMRARAAEDIARTPPRPILELGKAVAADLRALATPERWVPVSLPLELGAGPFTPGMSIEVRRVLDRTARFDRLREWSLEEEELAAHAGRLPQPTVEAQLWTLEHFEIATIAQLYGAVPAEVLAAAQFAALKRTTAARGQIVAARFRYVGDGTRGTRPLPQTFHLHGVELAE